MTAPGWRPLGGPRDDLAPEVLKAEAKLDPSPVPPTRPMTMRFGPLFVNTTCAGPIGEDRLTPEDNKDERKRQPGYSEVTLANDGKVISVINRELTPPIEFRGKPEKTQHRKGKDFDFTPKAPF